MENSINQMREGLEQAINAGNIDQAVQCLKKLKEANCDVKLSLIPNEGAASPAHLNYDENKEYLLQWGIAPVQAEQIAQEAADRREAYNIAVARGLINH